MRAIAIKCPNCAATIKAEENAHTATCEYCGTTSAVQRRTRILEIAVPVQAQPSGAKMPVATEKHSGCFVGLVLFGVLAAGIIGIVVAVVQCATGKSIMGPSSAERISYDGERPLVIDDINGDGKADIVAKAERIKPRAVFLAAWSPHSGKRLWLTPALKVFGEAHQLQLYRAGERIVVHARGPIMLAFASKDGTQLWEIRLHEKIETVCAGPDGRVRIGTADEKESLVVLEDGAIEPAKAEGICQPLPSSDEDEVGAGQKLIEWSNDYDELVVDDQIKGMDSDTAIYHAASNTFIALASKSPGTRVPMLAAYRWPIEVNAEAEDSEDPLLYMNAERDARGNEIQPEVLWKQTVPAGDPLAAQSREVDIEHVAMNDEIIAVVYEDKGGPHSLRLTAFRLKDGTRLFDDKMKSDSPYSGIGVGEELVMVSRWEGLFVYDAASGKYLRTID